MTASAGRPPADRAAALESLPARGTVLRPEDPGWSAYAGDVVMEGRPEAVVRPESEEEVRAILGHAAAHRIPVTAAGGQTSLTGSSVAEEGILLATERMQAIRDLQVDPGGKTATAVVEPGIFLGDFQRAMAAEGWFYPPDPTSRNEARLGATVATNATGEDCLLYGPTRRWIAALRVVLADGSVRVLERTGPLPPEEKATAGYYLQGEDLDLVVGSEGTLGIVTEIRVKLVRPPQGLMAGLAFFPDLGSALDFIVAARTSDKVVPRALEILDRGALSLGRGNPEGIHPPEDAGAAVYFKQEIAGDADREAKLSAWFELLEGRLRRAGRPDLLDRTVVVEDEAGRTRLRAFRHRISATLNETVRSLRAQGGGKVGTDWWVPFRRLPAFLERWLPEARGTGVDFVIFGHAGNGHPHVNFLPADAERKARARAVARAMCEAAVAEGGGVAGEHGLGKLKRDLLAVQYPPPVVERMREVKRAWDPGWILGRGNILAPEGSRRA